MADLGKVAKESPKPIVREPMPLRAGSPVEVQRDVIVVGLTGLLCVIGGPVLV